MEKETILYGNGFSTRGNRPFFIAHKSSDREEPLLDHLHKTARLAEKFAGAFGAGEMGYLVGLAHDIGKYSGSYQRYIRGGGPRIDHSTAGAKELYRIGAKEASFCAAGHHSGLPQEGRPEDLPDKVSLWGRLKREIPDYGAFGEEITFPEPESRVFESQFQRMFFVRMLFSSLTDADFLATEEFMSGGETERGGYDGLSTLLERLESCMEEKGWGAPKTPVDRMRREILTRCREAANGERGIYSLTAPTGSGKTAASLAFALRHGVKQGMRRVIYVIPHTSVIEQTAKVFREMLGEENVLEHHGGVSFDKADGGLAEKLRLSAENWDAPVIVTTSAQFFQSLYGTTGPPSAASCTTSLKAWWCWTRCSCCPCRLCGPVRRLSRPFVGITGRRLFFVLLPSRLWSGFLRAELYCGKSVPT